MEGTGELAVLVVDVQGDFTTFRNGALAVSGTDEAFIDELRRATVELSRAGYPIYATQDWHPADHVSFFTNHEGKDPFQVIRIDGRDQVLWPPHCVQGTENARILVDNNLFLDVVKKGQDPRFDSYSGFQDEGGTRTELEPILKQNGVTAVLVYGIATDYCVKATALDAIGAGFKVSVVAGLCRGVAPETTTQALAEMEAAGARIFKELDMRRIESLR